MVPKSYAIIGSGAVGALYGSMLAHHGHSVHFLMRSDYEFVQQNGWKIESPWGDFQLPSVNAYASADELPPCDVTIVATKSTGNDALPELLQPPTREGGVVLILQNGLRVEHRVAEFFEPQRIFGGCCFLCSNKVGPGHIKHLDFGRIVFGPLVANSPSMQTAQEICQQMSDAGIDVQTSDDLNMVRWRKLMWNITFNGLSVALDASTDQLINDPASLALSRDIITEVYQAALACGADIAEHWIEKTIDNTRNMVPYDSSMRLDFLAGRPMELDAILASPIAAAKDAGAAMPKTEMLLQVLTYMQAAKRADA